jgi:hypothetical protein
MGSRKPLLNFFDAEGQAVCADPLVDPEWFFNEPEYDLAKIICNQCPVIKACGLWAIQNKEPLGVYGGLTPDERNKLGKKSALQSKKQGIIN